jgi:hypothetical protein
MPKHTTKISITLQSMQPSSILSRVVVVVGLGTSGLSRLHDTPPSPWLTYLHREILTLICANLTSYKF